jgi:hypothetical protein
MTRRALRRLTTLAADYCWICGWWSRPGCGHTTPWQG